VVITLPAPASRCLSAIGLAVALLAGAAAVPASAAVVPVDPGPVAAGRPIVGTGQNLPPIVE